MKKAMPNPRETVKKKEDYEEGSRRFSDIIRQFSDICDSLQV